MIKGRKVLCINSCYPEKDSRQKIHGFESWATSLHFHSSQKFQSQTTKKSLPSAYINLHVLFRILLGTFANT